VDGRGNVYVNTINFEKGKLVERPDESGVD